MSVEDYAWWLLDSSCQAAVYGTLAWTACTGSSRWQAVSTGTVKDGQPINLCLLYQPKRPSEPTILYRCNDYAWRIDHNGAHSHKPVQTHLQLQGTNYYRALDPAQLDSPPVGTRLTLDGMRRLFYASASYLNVNTTGLTWNDPPREVQL